MTGVQTCALPILVEMLTYLERNKSMDNCLTVHGDVKNDLKELLGLDSVYSAKVLPYIDQLNIVESNINNVFESIRSLEKEIKQQIDSWTPNLTSVDYFEKYLQIDKHTRKHWVILSNYYLNELIVELSMIPDIWKYSVGCINVQHFGVIDLLFQANYVYLIDDDQELLDSTIEKIDLGARIRAKPYRLQGFNDLDFETNLGRIRTELRWGIPKNQLALVVCPNVFERYTIDHMKVQLQKIKNLLRPGGKIIFNVTNAQTPTGAKDVVMRTTSFVTKGLIQDLLESIGMTLEKWNSVNNMTSMMVVAKNEGVLQSPFFKPSRGMIKKS